MKRPSEEFRRPQTRDECRYGPRPCPWVSCRFHLYLDVSKNGSLVINQTQEDGEPRAPETLETSCALDVAEDGHHSLGQIGTALGMSRERVRQIEAGALVKLRRWQKRMAIPKGS